MNKALLVVLLAAGCSKTKIPECEELVKTAEKLEKCEKIPAENKKEISQGVKQIKSALKMLEDVGDQAEKSQLDTLANTCRDQNKSIRDIYEKVAPECLK